VVGQSAPSTTRRIPVLTFPTRPRPRICRGRRRLAPRTRRTSSPEDHVIEATSHAAAGTASRRSPTRSLTSKRHALVRALAALKRRSDHDLTHARASSPAPPTPLRLPPSPRFTSTTSRACGVRSACARRRMDVYSVPADLEDDTRRRPGAWDGRGRRAHAHAGPTSPGCMSLTVDRLPLGPRRRRREDPGLGDAAEAGRQALMDRAASLSSIGRRTARLPIADDPERRGGKPATLPDRDQPLLLQGT
jgi:hypothetical protein